MANKIKLKSVINAIDRDVVMSVLKKHTIRCSRVIKVGSDTLLLYCNDSQDVDKLFSLECVHDFKLAKCQLIVPPDLKAKKSVIVRKLDLYIYDQDIEALREEIEKENQWLLKNK